MDNVTIEFRLPRDYDSLKACMNAGKMRAFILEACKELPKKLYAKADGTDQAQRDYYKSGVYDCMAALRDLFDESGLDIDDI